MTPSRFFLDELGEVVVQRQAEGPGQTRLCLSIRLDPRHFGRLLRGNVAVVGVEIDVENPLDFFGDENRSLLKLVVLSPERIGNRVVGRARRRRRGERTAVTSM